MDVTAVIPLYNKAPYVPRALYSVLAQTCPPQAVIVVDDGSTDNGAKAVEEIGDRRIRLIRQANAGVSAARNRGIAETRTELIAFLDADDEWKPDFLQQIRRAYNDFPDCGGYATSYEVIGPGNLVECPPLPDVPPPPWVGILPSFFRASLRAAPFYTSSVCIRRHVFEERGAFPVGVRIGEDRLMWVKLALHYPIGYSPSRQAVYHAEAENRVCRTFTAKDLKESPAAAYVAGVIEKGGIGPELVGDLVEFHAQQEISRAKYMVKAGMTDEALILLARSRPRTPELRRQKILVSALARMPTWGLRLGLGLHRWSFRQGPQ